MQARKQDGSRYSRSTLRCHFQGINRHLSAYRELEYRRTGLHPFPAFNMFSDEDCGQLRDNIDQHMRQCVSLN